MAWFSASIWPFPFADATIYICLAIGVNPKTSRNFDRHQELHQLPLLPFTTFNTPFGRPASNNN